jgi:enamine deaminase RidA (YjgF/YER057c/UK114 family)
VEQRKLVTSGSPLEPQIGMSRAVRVGPILAVAGTAPIGPDGAAAHRGDVYAQSKLCLDIIRRAIEEAG